MAQEIMLTTLCYLEKDGKYLMLHRNKKENDINKDKYIGVGGHIEHGESPEECIIREIREETGLIVGSIKLRGFITFIIDDIDEYCFLFTSSDFEGEISECNEGDLEWIPKEEVVNLPIWEGDKVFFELLNKQEEMFSLKLKYVKDVLVDTQIY